MKRWKDIVSAPRDGTSILVCRSYVQSGGRVTIEDPFLVEWRYGTWRIRKAHSFAPLGFMPSHWAPLIPDPDLENYTDFVFAKARHPAGEEFVDVESPAGCSVKLGEWIHRDGEYVSLRLPATPAQIEAAGEMLEVLEQIESLRFRCGLRSAVEKGGDELTDILTSVREVIAKARGPQ